MTLTTLTGIYHLRLQLEAMVTEHSGESANVATFPSSQPEIPASAQRSVPSLIERRNE